jgi:hypothetical protein
MNRKEFAQQMLPGSAIFRVTRDTLCSCYVCQVVGRKDRKFLSCLPIRVAQY